MEEQLVALDQTAQPKPLRHFGCKQIMVYDKHSVDVEAKEVQHPYTKALSVTATIGNISVTMSHTFGAIDGAHSPLPDDHVQTMLDDLRERAARAAAHHYELDSQMDLLK